MSDPDLFRVTLICNPGFRQCRNCGKTTGVRELQVNYQKYAKVVFLNKFSNYLPFFDGCWISTNWEKPLQYTVHWFRHAACRYPHPILPHLPVWGGRGPERCWSCRGWCCSTPPGTWPPPNPCTVRKVFADFAVFDWGRYCKTLCDVKFRQIEGNGRKFCHIELSNSVKFSNSARVNVACCLIFLFRAT